jgi:hypothetical protein
MLNPRLYRAALVPIVVAVILAAFSLQDLPSPVTTLQAPDAFQRGTTASTLATLVREFPARRPGSSGDDALASAIAARLRAAGSYHVRTRSTSTQTVDGRRTVRTVIATRPGGLGAQIVVVADRESLRRGDAVALSGTAVMLELATVLAQGPVNRTITFVSTSGDGGGAAVAAAALQRPVDAVLVLGDLASHGVRQPILTTWSNGGGVAPLRLQRTIALALQEETGIPNVSPGTGTQLARFAFPVAYGDQGVFGQAGLPAVEISLGGERPAPAGARVDPRRMSVMGHGILRALTALDRGPDIGAAPAKVLITARKSIPSWAMRILVAMLALAPLVCAVDGFARLRRRREPVALGLIWVALAAAPLLAAAVLVRLLGAVGLLPAVPPTAVPPGAVPIGGTARIAMIAVVLVLILAWLAARAIAAAPAVGAAGLRGAGGAGALLLVLCAVAFVVWLLNPFAALLLVPALHLWLPIYAPGVALRRRAALALLVVGLLPFALVALADASSLGLRVDDFAWLWLLLTAGGHVSLATWVLWSLFGGCVAGTLVLALRAAAPAAPSGPEPVTVRGPLSYAGPGSLGGTDSALRR